MSSLGGRLGKAERETKKQMDFLWLEVLLPRATPEEGEAILRIVCAQHAGKSTEADEKELLEITRTLVQRAHARGLVEWDGSAEVEEQLGLNEDRR